MSHLLIDRLAAFRQVVLPSAEVLLFRLERFGVRGDLCLSGFRSLGHRFDLGCSRLDFRPACLEAFHLRGDTGLLGPGIFETLFDGVLELVLNLDQHLTRELDVLHVAGREQG